MASVHFKLIRPGRETRRLVFSTQPSWPALEDRIAELFDIPSDRVAVSYEDSDGDIVTLSSDDELLDYFSDCYKPGEPIRFTVLDTHQSRRAAREGVSAFVEDVNEEIEGGLPTMGPTMIFEVGDEEWQRFSRTPNIFGMQETEGQSGAHAFVEVIDSASASSKKGSELERAHSEHSSVHSWRKGSDVERHSLHSVSNRLRPRGNGKGKAFSDATKSIDDDEAPAKPPVRIYDVSDIDGSPRTNPMDLGTEHICQPRYSAFGSGGDDVMDSSSTAHPSEGGKPLPKTSSPSIHSPLITPRQTPALDLEEPPLEPTGEIPNPTPSFVHDVANLLDGLTGAFASHPELSEGLRNIVKNAVGGAYWETERKRVAGAAESVRVVAEEASERIVRAAGDIAHSEQDAVRRIAESLGGVFRVIGELSSTGAGGLSSTSNQIAYHQPPPGPPPLSHSRTLSPQPGPPPFHRHDLGVPSQDPLPFHHDPVSAMYNRSYEEWQGFGGPPHPSPPPVGLFSHRRTPPPFPDRFSHHRHHHGPPSRPDHYGNPGHPFRHGPPPLTGPRGSEGSQHQRSLPQKVEQMMHQPQRSNTWAAGGYAPFVYGSSYDPLVEISRPDDIHESKAQLEAAKAVYKAEKDRFRREKEEHRRMRREAAEKRAEEGRAPRIDGTTREETIVACLPLPSPSKGGRSKRPYAEIYSVPPEAAGVNYSAPVLPVESKPAVSRPRAPAGTTYSVPAPDVPSRPTQEAPASVTHADPAPVTPPQPVQAPPPWPIPPPVGASRRAQLSSFQDRILARLFDMGITVTSQPDMMDTVRRHADRTDTNEEEVLADVILALNIRGSPSPRPSGSSLPR